MVPDFFIKFVAALVIGIWDRAEYVEERSTKIPVGRVMRLVGNPPGMALT